MAERRSPAFRALLGYQVHSASEVVRRGQAMRLRREHGVSLMEWHTLALIEHLQPVRLRDLAADFGADKAQISRIVTALVDRGLVLRRALHGDARSAHLELSESGRDKAGSLSRSAGEDDRDLRGCLKPGELEQLAAILARVKARAQEMLDEEERRQPGTGH